MLIAAPDLLPTLKQRTGDVNDEVLAFSDADALRALEVITKRRPHVVAIERQFAATPRGAALINRIKADPSLVQSEIRVVSHDREYTRVSPRKPTEATPAQSRAAMATAAPAAVPRPVPSPLDEGGTRRAPRFKMAAKLDVVVDGNSATIIDLSTVGAQVVSGNALKPNQRVRVTLSDEVGTVRCNASVAWAKFEIPPGGGPRYRAGLDFVEADPAAVEGFCSRHKA